MKKPVFEGVATALVTPFKNGTIDLPTLQKLMDRQIGSGIDAIVICGTTGESATLTTQEQLSLISHAVDYAAGRCKIIAGTGSNSTAHALEMSRMAASVRFFFVYAACSLRVRFFVSAMDDSFFPAGQIPFASDPARLTSGQAGGIMSLNQFTESI